MKKSCILTVPDLPPRIDRGVKPPGGVLLPGPTPGRNPNNLRQTNQVCILIFHDFSLIEFLQLNFFYRQIFVLVHKKGYLERREIMKETARLIHQVTSMTVTVTTAKVRWTDIVI